MKRSRILLFADPAQYSANIRSADIEVLPTSKGVFEAQLTQVTLDQLWMQRFEETLSRVHRGAIRPDRKVFTFLTEDQPEVYNRGQLFSPGELCANDCDMQHVVTTGRYRLGGVSIRPSDLAAASKSMMGFEWQPEPCARFLRPAPELMKRLLELHAMVGAFSNATPELLEFPEVIRAVEHKLTHALLACLTDCNASKMKMAGPGHRTIVARFEAFLDAHPNSPLNLEQVCAAVGVAERTLRAACENHLGMGPIRYLNLRRMHLVRRALEQATSCSATVTEIAMSHGFWELGRFSVAYRELFNERPLATLRRPPNDRPTRAGRPSQLVA